MTVACGPGSSRQLSLVIGGADGGTIRVNGTNRQLPWSTTLDAGTAVTLEGVPEAGYAFYAWSGDHVSGENPTSLIITADTTVTPLFSRLPQLVFTPSTVEFGAVEVDSFRVVTVTVANHGGGLLTGTAETSAPFAIVEGAAFHLEAGATHNISVRYSPTAAGESTGQLRLTTGSGVQAVALSGTGTTNPPVLRGFNLIVTGDGTVYSEPAGIGCPSDCSATFVEGTRLLLSVTPSSALSTPRWSNCDAPAGNGVNGATCEIVINSDRLVFVDFTPEPTLVVTPATGDFGTVLINGSREVNYTVANQGGGTISGTVETSAPFSVLSGAAYTLAAGASQAVTIRFSPSEAGEAEGELSFTGGTGRTVRLSGYGAPAPPESRHLELSVTGNGRVISQPAGIDCPGACTATFTQGTEIRMESIPASPLGRSEWSGCDSPATNGSDTAVCELRLGSNRAVQVVFPATPDIVVSLTPGAATLLTGDSLPFTATISGTSDTRLIWSATGGAVSGTGTTVTYTAPDLDGTHTITATSAADPSRSAQAMVTVAARQVVSVVAGSNFSFALKNDGTVWAWGANDRGQLGIGTTVDSQVPIQISGLDNIVKVVAGGDHALALRNDGAVWTWGGSFVRSRPERHLGFFDAIDIAAGSDHSLVLSASGTVSAWGMNYTGQLGDGTVEDRAWEAEVRFLNDIRSISAGRNHSVAVDSQGRVYAWGWNESGQVGVRWESDDCGMYYWCLNEPRYIGQWVGSEPVAGGTTSMVVTDYGSVYAWGDNGMGQLGVQSSDECWRRGEAAGYWCSFSATRVSSLPGVRALSSGNRHSLALTRDGDVYAWGSAENGELGAPSSDGCMPGATPYFACSKTPVHVSILSGAVAVAAGGSHSLAVLSNGSVWSWGSNSRGQLGVGTTQTRTSPTLVQMP